MAITLWALNMFIILFNQCQISWEKTPGSTKLTHEEAPEHTHQAVNLNLELIQATLIILK